MYQKKILYLYCLYNYWFCYKNKNYPQVYLEECKYKAKKINTPRFINTKLELDSESDIEPDLESNTPTEN